MKYPFPYNFFHKKPSTLVFSNKRRRKQLKRQGNSRSRKKIYSSFLWIISLLQFSLQMYTSFCITNNSRVSCVFVSFVLLHYVCPYTACMAYSKKLPLLTKHLYFLQSNCLSFRRFPFFIGNQKSIRDIKKI